MTLCGRQTGKLQAPSESAARPWAAVAIAVALAAIALAVHLPSLRNDFVNWDDPYLVIHNPSIRGLTWENLQRIFSRRHFTDYYPATLLTYLLDFQLWRLNPTGYHLSSALFHAANAALVFWLLRNVLKGLLAPAAAALLFAVHPVQVESVAWVAERKNVVSGFFFLAAFVCCLRAMRGGVIRDRTLYGASLLLFLLAVFSKGSVLILPVLLFVYLVAVERVPLKRTLAPVAPFLAVGLLGAVSLFLAQYSANVIREEHGGPADLSTAVQMISVFTRYFALLLLPWHFSAHQPHPVGETAFSAWLPPALVVLALFIVALWWAWRRDRAMFFCLAWLPIGLMPVSHVVPFPNLMAGRYLYVPGIGAFGALCLALARTVSTTEVRPTLRALLIAIFLTCVGLYASITVKWSGYWRTSHALWTQTMIVTPDSDAAQSNLASHYDDTGLLSKAYRHLLRTIAIQPKDSGAHARLGGLYLRTGRPLEALTALNRAVEVNKNLPLAHFLLARTFDALGNRAAAIQEMHLAWRLDPDTLLPCYYLGLWSYEAGRFDQARRWLELFLHTDVQSPEVQRARELLLTIVRIM